MQYAFWIAIAVVFIAVAPAIYNAQKAKQAKQSGPGDSTGATGGSDGGYPGGIAGSADPATCAPEASDSAWGDSCDSGGGDSSGGGDGGGD